MSAIEEWKRAARRRELAYCTMKDGTGVAAPRASTAVVTHRQLGRKKEKQLAEDAIFKANFVMQSRMGELIPPEKLTEATTDSAAWAIAVADHHNISIIETSIWLFRKAHGDLIKAYAKQIALGATFEMVCTVGTV